MESDEARWGQVRPGETRWSQRARGLALRPEGGEVFLPRQGTKPTFFPGGCFSRSGSPRSEYNSRGAGGLQNCFQALAHDGD